MKTAYIRPRDRHDPPTVECDSQNVRLVMPFGFGFRTPEDRAWCEIPYGMLERPSYRPKSARWRTPRGRSMAC